MRTILSLLLLMTSILGAYSQPDPGIAPSPALNYDWRPGIISITELVGGPGLGTTDRQYAKYFYGITTMAGYQFTRNIKTCLGVGVSRHNEGFLYPVFADVRFSFSANEIVPFVAAQAGLNLDFNDTGTNAWPYISPSVGVKWVAANRTGLSLSAGVLSMSGGGIRHSFVNVRLGVEYKFKKAARSL